MEEVKPIPNKPKKSAILDRIGSLKEDILKYQEESADTDQIKFTRKEKPGKQPIEMEFDCNIHEVDIIRTKKTSFKVKLPILRKSTKTEYSEGP